MGEAKSDEAVATNTFYEGLDDTQSRLFEAIEPIEAKNVGRIRAWRTTQRALEAADPGH